MSFGDFTELSEDSREFLDSGKCPALSHSFIHCYGKTQYRSYIHSEIQCLNSLVVDKCGTSSPSFSLVPFSMC